MPSYDLSPVYVSPKRGVICGTFHCGLYFSDLHNHSRCSYYVVILRKGVCWPLWAPRLSSSCSCGKRIHIIIMESSFCHLSYIILALVVKVALASPPQGFCKFLFQTTTLLTPLPCCLCSFSPLPQWNYLRSGKNSCSSAEHYAFPQLILSAYAVIFSKRRLIQFSYAVPMKKSCNGLLTAKKMLIPVLILQAIYLVSTSKNSKI